MNAADMIQLASSASVARMLEREDFAQRYANGQSISIHEFLYPLMQGYDSVSLSADIEIGGTDQKFNLLMGRELQKQAGYSPQVIVTLPLLVGLDGYDKMSKSKNNYVGITESAEDIFGKMMSISDDLMWRYYELISLCSLETIAQLKQQVKQGTNPRDIKMKLAYEITERFTSQKKANEAYEHFIKQFQQKQMPDDMPEYDLSGQGIWIITNLLKQVSLVNSTSEARRMIKQNAVKIDGAKITDITYQLTPGASHTIQVGKRKYALVQI
jgi:tyrosyl-tRNA synthetase